MPTVPHIDPFTTFFARIWAVDIACPRCGACHILTHHQEKRDRVSGWDPYLGRFTCRNCHYVLILATLAYQVPNGAPRTPPADMIPKTWQQAQLRELLGPGGVMLASRRRLLYRQEANLFVEHPCTCHVAEIAGRGLFIDDDCPVHGHTPKPAWEHPVPPARKKAPHRWQDQAPHYRREASRRERARELLPSRNEAGSSPTPGLHQTGTLVISTKRRRKFLPPPS